MPVIPLYETPADPNAWHHVTAPGGYEWWHFEIENDAGVRVNIDLCDGDPFNTAYLRAYMRYRRHPTRVAPPVPRDFPCVRAAVLEMGTPPWRSDASLPPGAFRGSTARIDVSTGPCSLQAEGTSLKLLLRALASTSGGETLSAELLFQPVAPHVPGIVALSSNDKAVSHFQIANAPTYVVSGVARLAREIRMEGKGRFEHRFGTGPIESLPARSVT